MFFVVLTIHLFSCVNAYANTCFSVVYINLAHRSDRNDDIQRELNRVNLKYTRIEAETYQRPGIGRQRRGAIGVGLSHITALHRTNDTVLVLEDDIVFLRDFSSEICDIINTDSWDVILLGYSTKENCKLRFCRTKNSQTASGYIVRREYKKTLLQNFLEATKELKKGGEYPIYAIDQYWKRLQKKDRWYYINPRTIKQKKSFSDIEGRVVDYHV